jgi:hypothetical protein
MGVIIVLAILLIVLILILAGGSTSSRQAILNTVGLDLSESAKESSIERDKIRKANLHINSAEDFVNYHFPERSKNKLEKWKLIKQTINNEFEEFQSTSGLIEKGWYFTGNSEIQEICNRIIDAKIKKLQNS